MSPRDEASVLKPPAVGPEGTFTVTSGPCRGRRCVLYLAGSLRAPVDGELRDKVGALLARGERIIVLDVSGVQDIDAAGVSELLRAHNMAAAANSALQVVHARPWVRQMLERVELFDLLSEE